MNKAFFQCQYIIRWGKCGDLHFTRYTTYVHKTIFFTNLRKPHTNENTCYPLSTIQIIASIWLSSHSPSLWCERRCWGTSDEASRLYTFYPKQVCEFEYHTFIQCFPITTYEYALDISSTIQILAPISRIIIESTLNCDID